MNPFRKLWPRSLFGQLMLVVALALLAAQLLNLAMHYRASERLRFAQAVAPVIVMVGDPEDIAALPRFRHRPPRMPPRELFRFEETSAVAREGRERSGYYEARIADALETGGIGVRSVEVAAATGADAPAPRLLRALHHRNRGAGPLRISVELDDGRWLNGWIRLRPSGLRAIGVISVQSVILYIVVLAAVFWFARRVSRPLRELTEAAENFRAGVPQAPVPVSGPGDIVRLIEAHNAMRERIGAMLDEKDHMLGAIGHDLRTPLAALRIRAENVPDEAERGRMVETIEDMSRMLEDILSLARLGRASGEAERLDLTALVDSAIEDFRDLGGEVTFEDGERLVVEGRESLLKRAVRNLIDNALRYGGRATVRLRTEAGRAIVEIDDEGPGIPEEKLETVLEPFARLDASRNRDAGGSGLGLALARAIVRDHGGELALENRAAGGLRAIISLPLG